MRHKSLLIVLIAVILTLSPLLARSDSPTRVAAQSNEYNLPGLQAPVTVIYDSYGIPHIYAENTHDLFMVQGFVVAQDRWWQMEWSRRLASGRLAEIAPDMQGQDIFLRTVGLRYAAEQNWGMFSEEGQMILQAYADGVNAYLEGKTPAEAAVEYQYLAEQGVTLEIEPWTPLDTLAFGNALAFNLSGNFSTEIERALIGANAGPLASIALALLFPPYPADQPTITEPGAIDYQGEASGMLMSSAASPAQVALPMDYSRVSARLVGDIDLDKLALPLGQGIGAASNSWVVSGSMTDTGLPYLANDPHLGIQMPATWHEIGLHCVEKTAECPYNVVGVMFPGAPGVIIGNNDRISWGFTVGGVDTQDLYTLTLNPDNPMQYMYNGAWTDFEVRTETVGVQGADPVEVQVLTSVGGPVISQVLGFGQGWALRWTASDPSTLLGFVMELDKASNFEEFRAALALLDAACQNGIYADVDGNIGYQLTSRAPIRVEGHDGTMPVDGSTDQFAWQGYVPTEEMPMLYNPESGYIVTANNNVVGPDYPYFLMTVNEYGFRAKRIEALIQNDPDGVITLDDIKLWQGDNYNQNADTLVPALQQLAFDDPRLNDAVAWLGEWDRYNDADSPQAALLEVFWAELIKMTFADDFGQTPGGGARYWTIMRTLLSNKTNAIYGQLWDNGDTADVVETPDDILKAAFASAYDMLVGLQGEDPNGWRWGKLHLAEFIAAPLGESGDAELDALFNERVETGGGEAMVNRTGWSTSSPFGVRSIPSQRQIVDMSNLDNTQRIIPLGQSGDPLSPHYSDQMEMWTRVEYRHSWFSREAVEADAIETVTFMPADA